LRDKTALDVTLRPSAFPVKMPQLPGPPPVGSEAPPLKVDLFRGGERVVHGKPKLLFFWATWCVPCKYSLPEILAFGRERGIEVVAITDEPPEILDKFFAQLHDPFPKVVAIDPLRITFQSYGVSGTPTFVLVDDHEVVRYYQTGYKADGGLSIDGWKWNGPTKKTEHPAPKAGG
jgi:thiol-disulfide isomerase/thioredoxin